jgi:hypothetical protein
MSKAMFVFDFEGTLEGNKELPRGKAEELLLKLRQGGHKIMLYTSRHDIPEPWVNLVDGVWTKGSLTDWDEVTGRVVYVDDERNIREALARYARTRGPSFELSVLSAEDLGVLAA